MTSPRRRLETDLHRLMLSDYDVTLANDSMQEFTVVFKGPDESTLRLIALALPSFVQAHSPCRL